MIRKKRIRYTNTLVNTSVKLWRDSLQNIPAFIIGNAPSLKEIDLSILENHFTIGINRAFYKIEPTILFWQDAELWFSEKHEINKIQSIKICRDVADIQGRFYHFKLSAGPFKLPENPAALHGRGNSGAIAFQFAYSLGCNPIILIGMDCCYQQNMTNFYGKNPSHKPHTLKSCIQGLKWIKNCDSRRDIINCSNNKVFDHKLTVDDAVNMIDFYGSYNREKFIRKIFSFSGKTIKAPKYGKLNPMKNKKSI